MRLSAEPALFTLSAVDMERVRDGSMTAPEASQFARDQNARERRAASAKADAHRRRLAEIDALPTAAARKPNSAINAVDFYKQRNAAAGAR